MPGGHETLRRQWLMLRLIPRFPKKVTAGDVTNRLNNDGYRATKRTVERDLQALSESFPLVSDERAKPFGWSWSKDAPILLLPGLSNTEALAFVMLEQHLRQLLPASALESLAPHFRLAAEKLSSANTGTPVAAWARKIRVVHPSQALLPSKVNSQVQRTVTEALLLDRQIDVLHQKRGDPKPSHYVLNPLALVQRGQVTYLVATAFAYKDALLFPLHRIVKAILLDFASRRPKGFSLDAYIASGAFGFGTGRKIRLEAIFREGAGDHLYETPIDRDQQLTSGAKGLVKLIASVPDTEQLRWWLLGFGDHVEVLAPRSIRKQFGDTVRSLSRIYLGSRQ